MSDERDLENLIRKVALLESEVGRLKQLLSTKRSNKGLAKSSSKLYLTWTMFKQHCNNPRSCSYKYYGGIGVKMLADWNDSFELFEDWVKTNLGDRPDGLALIRINKQGDVCPGNLKWGNPLESTRGNRKKVVQMDLKGSVVAIHNTVEDAKKAINPEGGGSLSRSLNKLRPPTNRNPSNYYKGYLWDFIQG